MSVIYASMVDAVGTTLTVETTKGYTYCGKLESVDKVGMNLRLSTVLVTQPNGMKDVALGVIIPGPEQKFIKLPSTMKLAPQFHDARTGEAAASATAAAGHAKKAGGGGGGSGASKQKGGFRKGAAGGFGTSARRAGKKKNPQSAGDEKRSDNKDKTAKKA